jgi:hypothetical protein
MAKFFLLWDSCGIIDVGRPLWQEDECVVYSCYLASPAQSFSGPSPVRLQTIFYYLKIETPSTWRARSQYLYPPVTRWHTLRVQMQYSEAPCSGAP